MDETSITTNSNQRANKKLDFHKVFAAIGIILIVLIIVVGGIWYFVQSAEDKVPVNDDTTVNKIASSSAKSKTASNSAVISDWKTFTSTRWGFSLKYPKEWQITKETDTGASISNQAEITGGLFIEVYINNDLNSSTYNNVKTYKVGETTKVDAKIPGTSLKDTYTRLIDTKIDGYDAVRYELEPGFGDADNPKTYNAIINKSGKYYLIRNKLYNQSFDDGVKLLDQIISTFKFQ